CIWERRVLDDRALARGDVDDHWLNKIHQVARLPVEDRRILRLELIDGGAEHVVHETRVPRSTPVGGELLGVGRPADGHLLIRVSLGAVLSKHRERGGTAAAAYARLRSAAASNGANGDVVVLNECDALSVRGHAAGRRRWRAATPGRGAAAPAATTRAATSASTSRGIVPLRRKTGSRRRRRLAGHPSGGRATRGAPANNTR